MDKSEEQSSGLQQSDVVVEYIHDEAITLYGATAVMANPGIYIKGDHELPEWKERVARWKAAGKKVFSWIYYVPHSLETFEMLAEDAGLQQCACRDPFNNPLVVTHLADYCQNGVRMYRLCHNQPRFREHLRDRIYLSIESGVEGFAFDEWGGSAFSYYQGGCFCDKCLEGFRLHLKEKYSEQALREKGIENIDAYDYRKAVTFYGNSPKTYLASLREGEIPLVSDFLEFQYKTAADFLISLKRYANALRNEETPFSFNNSYGAVSRHGGAHVLEHIQVFTQEVDLASDGEGISKELIRDYKLATGLGKLLSTDPMPLQWAYIREKGFTALLKHWIAFTYASGHIFRAPVKVWARVADRKPAAGTPQSNWYFPPVDELAPIYHFIQENRSLLDGWEAYEPVCLLVDDTADRETMDKLSEIGRQLLNQFIPFGFAVTDKQRRNDARLATQLSEAELCVCVREVEKAISDQCADKLHLVHESDGFERLKHHAMITENGEQVWVLPRIKKNGTETEMVLHVVNRALDVETNSLTPQENVKITLPRTWLGSARTFEVAYVSLESNWNKTQVDEAGDSFSITIDKLGTWGIIHIR